MAKHRGQQGDRNIGLIQRRQLAGAGIGQVFRGLPAIGAKAADGWIAARVIGEGPVVLAGGDEVLRQLFFQNTLIVLTNDFRVRNF